MRIKLLSRKELLCIWGYESALISPHYRNHSNAIHSFKTFSSLNKFALKAKKVFDCRASKTIYRLSTQIQTCSWPHDELLHGLRSIQQLQVTFP
jgi:hypothetical protein